MYGFVEPCCYLRYSGDVYADGGGGGERNADGDGKQCNSHYGYGELDGNRNGADFAAGQSGASEFSGMRRKDDTRS